MIKDCLRNAPSQRPTAEQLVTILEEMKGAVEGPCGELVTMDAARQIKIAMTMIKEKDQLAAKDREIQQLQQQLEVCYAMDAWYRVVTRVFSLHVYYHYSYKLKASCCAPVISRGP